MGEPDRSSAPAGKGRRLSWLTVGEAAAVLAVVIAALSYWDAHREHAVTESQFQSQARAESAFVMVGSVDAEGREIALRPLQPSEAIQSQHLVFPTAVRAQPVDIYAARPRIAADWIVPGLGRALDNGHVKGEGQGRLPVAVVTTYVEGGETHTDRAEYAIGYAWRSRFLVGRQISLQGISLVRRNISADPQVAVDRRWAQGGVAPAHR